MHTIKGEELDHYAVFTTHVKQFVLHYAMTYQGKCKDSETNEANLHIHELKIYNLSEKNYVCLSVS